VTLRFVKGHGTENDFVLLPDPDGVLGEPSPDLVRALCDRRAGIGADGVIRVVRTDATDDPHAAAARDEAAWFMDYFNSDGSPSEMCGNGVRVLGRYLAAREGVDVAGPLPVATRAGVKRLTFAGGDPDGAITVDMGRPAVLGATEVGVPGHTWEAVHVDMGNPHAVAFVDDLADAGPLHEPPEHDEAVYPAGVNVEFVVRRGPGHVALRVHERGSGETRSCGTGACAAMVASAVADAAAGRGGGRGSSYVVDVPGGTLEIAWTEDNRVLMTGPAVLVAEGNWVASCWRGWNPGGI
jgi:diaminopimelate epimerase